MDVPTLIKHRGTIKAQFTRAQTYALAVDRATVTVENIKNRRALLDTHFKRFEEIQQEIEEKTNDPDQLIIQLNERAELEEKYLDIVAVLDEIISAKTPVATTTSATATSSAPTSFNVKLPSIELPTFNGNYADWISFFDLFSSTIDSRSGLADAQKLQYLKTSVKGEAADLIKSLTITNDNYQTAWDALKKRYHNQREIVNSLLTRIFSLPHLHKESSSCLQKMLDTTRECLNSLTTQGRPTEHWDDLVNFIIVQRLDPESRRQWSLKQKGTSLSTFQELSDFLENHARSLKESNSSTHKSAQASKSTFASHHGFSEARCKICNGSYPIFKCETFTRASIEERSSLAKKHRLCFNCLRADHQSQQCNSKSTCGKCGKRHNTLLHFEKSNSSSSQQSSSSTSAASAQSAERIPSSSFFASGEVDNTQVLLHTVIAKVKDSWGNDQYVRILLDSGSQATMVTERCVNALGLKRQHSRVTVSGISSSSVGQARGEVQLKLLSTVNDACLSIHALVFPKVTGVLPRYNVDRQRWSHLDGLSLADPSYFEPGPIDILLGADYTAAVMREGQRNGERYSPIAQNTIFGWVLCGRVNIDCGHVVISNHTQCELERIVQRFWELEQIPDVQNLTPDEQFCEEHFRDNFVRDDEGRFIVQLPIKLTIEQLGGSKDMAIQRLKQVERRLSTKPEQKAEYVKFMREYESLGHMEEIPQPEQEEVIGTTNYLPHHFVLKADSTTTKFRVVFDASAKTTSGISFNDTLYVGKTVQNDLFAILIKFRLHPVVIKTDIEKMFRQFRVDKLHCDLQRIVWRETPDQPIRHYRLLKVTYGTSPAPFLSTRCLMELAIENKDKFPTAAAALEDDTYVDDIITGASDSEQGRMLVKEFNTVSESASLKLRKWCSNDASVSADIPIEFREKETSFDLDKCDSIKALGVRWNTQGDFFTFTVASEPVTVITKRVVLSELAKVYDPIGLITPITIVARILFQDLWKVKDLDWESSVPAAYEEEWRRYMSQLKNVQNINISRCINPIASQVVELHGFSDASIRAYGAVMYLRVQLPDGSYQSTMITSRSRVAPIKILSIERLELCAAVLLAELTVATTRALKLNCPVFAWTNSTITLRYIAAHPSRWKTFIAHRVARIQARVPAEQ